MDQIFKGTYVSKDADNCLVSFSDVPKFPTPINLKIGTYGNSTRRPVAFFSAQIPLKFGYRI